MTNEILELSIIMPCLNEETNVLAASRRALSSLDRFGISGEVIVVDDGSSDETFNRANAISQEDGRVRVLRHEKPQGIGAAFWLGVKGAKKDYVVMMPGDNENDPDEVLIYFPLFKEVDVIVPFVMNVEVRSRMRRIVSSIYRLIINLSFGTRLNYTNGTVMYNRSILLDMELRSKGFFYQAELLVRLIRKGYLFAEVPTFLEERKGGKTKALTFEALRRLTGGYLKLLWNVHIARSVGQSDVVSNKGSATSRRSKS